MRSTGHSGETSGKIVNHGLATMRQLISASQSSRPWGYLRRPTESAAYGAGAPQPPHRADQLAGARSPWHMDPFAVTLTPGRSQVAWNDVAVSDNSLEQSISSLRRAPGPAPNGPPYIETLGCEVVAFIAE